MTASSSGEHSRYWEVGNGWWYRRRSCFWAPPVCSDAFILVDGIFSCRFLTWSLLDSVWGILHQKYKYESPFLEPGNGIIYWNQCYSYGTHWPRLLVSSLYCWLTDISLVQALQKRDGHGHRQASNWSRTTVSSACRIWSRILFISSDVFKILVGSATNDNVLDD